MRGLGIFLGVALPALCLANTLSTAASNNGSGGIFLDLTAGPSAVSITSFDSPFTGTAGTTVNVEVWTRPGSYVGFDASSAGWTLTQTILATRAGTSVNAPIVLTSPLLISAGQTMGICLQATASGGVRYTGTASIPPVTNWTNGELSLFSDVSRVATVAFTGTRFANRCFSGNVNYDLVGSTPRVSGTVVLEDFFGSVAGRTVVMEVRSGGTAVQTENVTLGVGGSYSFDATVPPGTYDVAAKGSHWLRKQVAGVSITGAGPTVNFSLPNGDVDGDNEVTIGDYSLLSTAFGSGPGDPNWDPEADLDGDDEVTIGDYAILSNNFGMLGDN